MALWLNKAEEFYRPSSAINNFSGRDSEKNFKEKNQMVMR
jgi:hypothetical protein